jgi:hypothetical protein
MPTFFGQLRSHLSPLLPPRRRPLQKALPARPARKAARSECRLALATPRRRGRRRAPSSVSLKPPLPAPPAPLRPPPAPRGPFQTPWARGGCSGRKLWPRLGPGRCGCERGGGGGGGGGGAPGTVSPATRRGRARRDAESSRSTAGARRRRRRRWWWWWWQREPRDRSITGSHGARAFSSLGAGARLGTRPRGGRGRRPSSSEGGGTCAGAEGASLGSSSSAAGSSSPR